ncbi:hypothetical protein DFH08DRAFT_831960, partial [Mycena albidolilacea]
MSMLPRHAVECAVVCGLVHFLYASFLKASGKADPRVCSRHFSAFNYQVVSRGAFASSAQVFPQGPRALETVIATVFSCFKRTSGTQFRPRPSFFCQVCVPRLDAFILSRHYPLLVSRALARSPGAHAIRLQCITLAS